MEKQSILKRLSSGLSSHVLTAVLTAVVVGSGAAYAAMTVHDPKAEATRLEELSNAAEQLEQLQDQLKEAKEQVNQLTTLNGVIGEIGGIQAGFDTSALQSAARMGCQGFQGQGFGLPENFQMPDMTSICDAKEFVSEHLSSPVQGENGTVSRADFETFIDRRTAAVEESAQQGYAIGLSEREAVQLASSDLAALGAEATATTTQREDIANLRKIALRQATEMVQVRALLGALVELESARAMREMGSHWSGNSSDAQPADTAKNAGSNPFGEE